MTLRKAQLVIGNRYRGIGRNFNEATWNGRVFVGKRYKGGSWFDDEEYHLEDGGTFRPLEEIRNETPKLG